MRKVVFAATVAMAFVGALNSASAGIAYDASLVSPGVYFGTGNPNAFYTVATNNNVEIGLSAIDRYVTAITPSANVYRVLRGDSSHGGSAWGVNFSINLQAGGGSLALSGIDAVLSVHDAVTGFSATIPEFLASLVSNTCYGPAGVDGSCLLASDYAVQNSEPGSLLAAIGDTGFNDRTPDSYDISIAVYGCSGVNCTSNLLASDSIQVDAVSEPGSFGILAAALGLVLLLQRRCSMRGDAGGGGWI